MADTLEPIVIPPLVAGKFTCSGAGLRYEEQERVAPDVLRTLLLPSGARNGIADRERPKAWWGAQSLFYGLKHTKTMTITQLRAQLEDALRANKGKGSLRVPQDILDLEHRSNQEFRELNAQVRDKTGLGGGKTEGAKTKTTKKRKLEDEAVKEKGKGKEKAVEEVGGPQKKQRTKKSDADIAAATSKPRAKHAPAAAKATPPAEVKPAAARPKQTARKGTGIPAHEPVAAPKRTVQTARKKTGGVPPKMPSAAYDWLRIPNDYDDEEEYTKPGPSHTKQTAPGGPRSAQLARRTDATSGMWIISCPYINEHWSQYDYMQFTFNIVTRKTGQGKNSTSSLECEFELGLFHGLMRSTRVEARPDGAYVTLEWAGKEEDGPVICPEKGQTGYIKFTGNKLKGRINEVPLCGEHLDFEGEWHGVEEPIERSWDDFSPEAYERANRARWGGGW